MENYIVYLLINTSNNYTYLGITNNSERRLKQHNGELSGGAKYTRNFKQDGVWKYYLQISNLSKSQSLSIERSIKNIRKYAVGSSSLDKRLYCINKTLKKYNNVNYLVKYFY